MNRCLTEGRQALTVRLAGIEGGIECQRLAPHLSALADGEADAEALALLRPHLKTCLSCRARLREFRAAPARVAALVPAALVAATPGSGLRGAAESAVGALQQKADALLAATHHKAVVLGERAQTAAELLTGQKVAVLAASAAALAGGGTAVDQMANHHGPPRHAAAAQQPEPPASQPTDPPPDPSPQLTREQQPTTEQAAPLTAPPPPPELPASPDPAGEFDASGASAASAAPTSPGTPDPEPAPTAAAPRSTRPAPRAPQNAREFAP